MKNGGTESEGKQKWPPPVRACMIINEELVASLEAATESMRRLADEVAWLSCVMALSETEEEAAARRAIDEAFGDA